MGLAEDMGLSLFVCLFIVGRGLFEKISPLHLFENFHFLFLELSDFVVKNETSK